MQTACLAGAFANLVDNTLARHGGVVTRVNVSAQVKDDALHVFYSDNGRGSWTPLRNGFSSVDLDHIPVMACFL